MTGEEGAAMMAAVGLSTAQCRHLNNFCHGVGFGRIFAAEPDVRAYAKPLGVPMDFYLENLGKNKGKADGKSILCAVQCVVRVEDAFEDSVRRNVYKSLGAPPYEDGLFRQVRL
ncbi:hypothetical protein M885DRAFT_499889 [Pelagophyceae sp. CCMP2097]|nr:hypothetical protein M885DRAFT_499889 [Pelagophyceae sp. CCMP2097]|mmetsp:Transcript_24868/g.85853  ORF Transcript_24868/g.85853 Transcript_24868/m.85853 type:complete len:114 (-) Transcript_24868:778-1119(-)